MFRDIILMKYEIKNEYHDNYIKALYHHTKYKHRLTKLLYRLYNDAVDIELLKGFYDFLLLTSIHETDEFKNKYSVILYSDKNTIKFTVSSDVSFTISIFKDTRLSITYYEDDIIKYMFDMTYDMLNTDKRDRSKHEMLMKINTATIDIIIYSVLLFLDKKG